MKAQDAERFGVVPGYDPAAWRNAQWEFRLWGSVVVRCPIAQELAVKLREAVLQ